MSDIPTPSVGRIVHYVSYGTPGGEYESECRAAVITEVNDIDGTEPVLVGLAVLNPSGMFFNRNIEADFSRAPEGGTWHWPERV